MMSAAIRAEEDCLKPLGEAASNLLRVSPLVWILLSASVYFSVAFLE